MKEWNINGIHFTHRPLEEHRSNYEVVQNTPLPSTLSQHHLASFHDNNQPVTEYVNTLAFLDAFVQWIQPLMTLRSFNSQDSNKFDKWSQGASQTMIQSICVSGTLASCLLADCANRSQSTQSPRVVSYDVVVEDRAARGGSQCSCNSSPQRHEPFFDKHALGHTAQASY